MRFEQTSLQTPASVREMRDANPATKKPETGPRSVGVRDAPKFVRRIVCVRFKCAARPTTSLVFVAVPARIEFILGFKGTARFPFKRISAAKTRRTRTILKRGS